MKYLFFIIMICLLGCFQTSNDDIFPVGAVFTTYVEKDSIRVLDTFFVNDYAGEIYNVSKLTDSTLTILGCEMPNQFFVDSVTILIKTGLLVKICPIETKPLSTTLKLNN